MPNTIEQLSAKTGGTVEAVKAGYHGLRGVFLHLAEEHGEIKAMMKQVSKHQDPQGRLERYSKVRARLLSHERAELAAVYSPLADKAATCELVQLHRQEASELESAVRAVDALDAADQAWRFCFERLLALVERHADEEEKDFFLKAQSAIGEAAAEELRSSYESAKISAEKQLA